MRFDELNLEDAILDGLDAMNFQEATPVQEQTIPVILAKKDIIACAQTGTGKTAAYVLPIINELSKGGFSENAVNAVIMAPTRELAQQIDQQIAGFTYFVPISAVANGRRHCDCNARTIAFIHQAWYSRSLTSLLFCT